jgi:hypothetical protein
MLDDRRWPIGLIVLLALALPACGEGPGNLLAPEASQQASRASPATSARAGAGPVSTAARVAGATPLSAAEIRSALADPMMRELVANLDDPDLQVSIETALTPIGRVEDDAEEPFSVRLRTSHDAVADASGGDLTPDDELALAALRLVLLDGAGDRPGASPTDGPMLEEPSTTPDRSESDVRANL